MPTSEDLATIMAMAIMPDGRTGSGEPTAFSVASRCNGFARDMGGVSMAQVRVNRSGGSGCVASGFSP